MTRELIEIVIPIYKSELSEFENISLTQCFRVLKGYSIVMCKPVGLSTLHIEARFPFTRIESFESHFFDSIANYNRLMLATSFYERFIQSKYILIFQPDVFIFRDDLPEWVAQDFDYIGAPWVYKNDFGRYIQWLKMSLSRIFYYKSDVIHKYEAKGRVGNGGFSLRKTKTHRDIAIELESDMERFLVEQDKYYFNEDLYWSIIPQRRGYNYRIPSMKEAILFAFDHSPKILFERTKYLPMAAHGWFTKKNLPFWMPIIEAEFADNKFK